MATPNMILDLPVPNTTPPPDWANMLNAAFLLVDGHDHTTGKGPLVPIAGLDISGAASSSTYLRGDGAWAALPPSLTEGAAAYDMMFMSVGAPTNNQVLGRIVMVRNVTIPVNCAGSRGNVDVVPTAPASLYLKVNGVTQVTVGVSVGGVFTFVNAAPIALVAGDVVTFVAQAVADATMADIACTIAGVF